MHLSRTKKGDLLTKSAGNKHCTRISRPTLLNKMSSCLKLEHKSFIQPSYSVAPPPSFYNVYYTVILIPSAFLSLSRVHLLMFAHRWFNRVDNCASQVINSPSSFTPTPFCSDPIPNYNHFPPPHPSPPMSVSAYTLECSA